VFLEKFKSPILSRRKRRFSFTGDGIGTKQRKGGKLNKQSEYLYVPPSKIVKEK
jgi:hypothetical protein